MARTKSIIAAVLIVAFTATAAEARYCYNPRCLMCNRLFGPLPGYDRWGNLVGQAPSVDKYRPAPLPTVSVPRAPAIDSTPHAVVDAMLAELDLQADDILYDLGCGDGRFLIAAVEQYGCRAVGIEIDHSVAELARANVRASSFARGRTRVVTGDATKYFLDQATAVVVYQLPPLLKKLIPRLSTNRIASYMHPVPGKANREINVDGHQIYVVMRTPKSDWFVKPW